MTKRQFKQEFRKLVKDVSGLDEPGGLTDEAILQLCDEVLEEFYK